MDAVPVINKLLRGSILRITVLGSNVAVSFFVMPFLIHSLGDRWYGFWALAGNILGYYGLLDLGLSSAVTRFVSQAFGREKNEEINTLVNSAIGLFSIIGIVVLLLAVSTAAFVPFFMKNAQDVNTVRWVIVIISLGFAVGFPFRALSGILYSKFRYDLISLIQLLKLAIRTTLVVVFIKLGYSVIAMAIITMAVDLLGYTINFFMVRSQFRQLDLNVRYFRFQRIRKLFGYGKYTFVSQLADQLRFRIDSAVIAAFLGLTHVTVYQIASRLTDYFVRFLISSVGTLIPVFSQLEGQRDFDTIRRWFTSSTRMAVTITLFFGLSIIFYAKVFIEKWMGVEYGRSYYILTILVVASIVDLVQIPSVTLLYGISKHRYYAFTSAMEGLSNLIISLILVQKYGLIGVAAGTAIPLILFRLIPLPTYTCKAIDFPVTKYFLNCIVIPAVKVIVPLAIYFWLALPYLKPDYFRISLLFTIQAVFFLPIAYLICLQSGERQYMVAAFRNT
jgi:O-antigen/teichoic acid export membrane protein